MTRYIFEEVASRREVFKRRFGKQTEIEFKKMVEEKGHLPVNKI